MKKLFLASVAMLACASALAVLPTYRTFSGTMNSLLNTTIVCPADPNSQIRIVSLAYKSDTNIATLSFSTGTEALYIQLTNSSTSVTTNYLNTTNGLAVNQVLVLQQGGICYTSTIASLLNSGTGTWNSLTNLVNGPNGPAGAASTNVSAVVLASGAWGVAALATSDVYVMSTATAGYTVGAGTNIINGDAIYVGNYGRPVLVQLGTANVTNSIPILSVHYDSQSN